MYRARPLRIMLIGTLATAVAVVVWLQMDSPLPNQPLFAASENQRHEIPSQVTELAKLGEAAEKLMLRPAGGKPLDVLGTTGEEVRERAVVFLDLEVVKQSPSRVASAIAALRRDHNKTVVVPELAWRQLLIIGKILSLRVEAMMVTEGADSAWKQALQGFEYAETLYASASSISQLARARTIQSYFARTVCAAIVRREWPPKVLAEIAKHDRNLKLGPHLLRSLEHEYTSAVAMAKAESSDRPAFLQPILYQPNRTEALWSSTLGQAILALRRDRPALAYRLAVERSPAREQVPILWRNWLGYQHSVPSIQVCIGSISMIANAELQMQLVRLAANVGRHYQELGTIPENLEALAQRFPETNMGAVPELQVKS